jgi:hypothetical protein
LTGKELRATDFDVSPVHDRSALLTMLAREGSTLLRHRQTVRLVALAAFPLLLVLCCVALSRISGGTAVSDSSKVHAALQRYESVGLFKSSQFSDRADFTWPKFAITFPAGVDLDQFLARVDAAEAKHAGPEFVQLPFVEFANQIGLLFTRGTQFEGKFQVNRAPKEDFVNLYVLDNDPNGLAKHFSKNCEYVGYYNAIICDAALFKYYFSIIDAISATYDITSVNTVTREEIPIKGEQLDDVKKLIKQSIVVWVLGHEIGHSVLHKDVLLHDHVRLHFDSEYNRYEQEADGFVADGLIRDAPLATAYWVAGGEFIQQEFRRIYREQARKGDPAILQIDSRDFVLKNKIPISYSKYTVPMILRAVRIVNRMLDAAPQIDSTGFYKRVDANIQPIVLSPDRYWFWLLFGITCLLGCAVLVSLFWSLKQQGKISDVDHS